MPEISDTELRQFVAYQALNMTPNEISKKIRELEQDNKDQRDQIRGLKDRVPGDDVVVLPKSEADALKEYQELGKPADLKKAIKTGQEAQGELAKARRRNAALNFVKAAGLADEAADVLVAVPDLSGAAFEVRDGTVEVNGQQVQAQVPTIVIPGANGGSEETVEFAKAQERWPVLKGLKTATPEDRRSSTTRLPFTKLGSGDKPGSESVYDRIRRERKEAQEKQKQTTSVPLEDRLGMTRAQ